MTESQWRLKKRMPVDNPTQAATLVGFLMMLASSRSRRGERWREDFDKPKLDSMEPVFNGGVELDQRYERGGTCVQGSCEEGIKGKLENGKENGK